MKAQLSYEYTKQWLTEEMAFQITDDPNAPRTVQITKNHIKALKGNGSTDLVITETKDFTVLREQQAGNAAPGDSGAGAVGPVYMKLGIQLTELRDKEGLMKMIDEQSQPQPERPKMTIAMDWKEFTPEMKAYIAMTAFQSQELAQVFIQQSEDRPSCRRSKRKWRSRKLRKARAVRWSAGRSTSRRYRPRCRAGWKCKDS